MADEHFEVRPRSAPPGVVAPELPPATLTPLLSRHVPVVVPNERLVRDIRCCVEFGAAASAVGADSNSSRTAWECGCAARTDIPSK